MGEGFGGGVIREIYININVYIYIYNKLIYIYIYICGLPPPPHFDMGCSGLILSPKFQLPAAPRRHLIVSGRFREASATTM